MATIAKKKKSEKTGRNGARGGLKSYHRCTKSEAPTSPKLRITTFELFYDTQPQSDEAIIAAIREAYLETRGA